MAAIIIMQSEVAYVSFCTQEQEPRQASFIPTPQALGGSDQCNYAIRLQTKTTLMQRKGEQTIKDPNPWDTNKRPSHTNK